MKKLTMLLLSAIMLFSVVFINAADNKPKKISVMLNTITKDPDGQTEWIAEYEKLTGIKLDLNNPAANGYIEKVKITLASGGEGLDLFEVPTEDYANYAQQGVLYPLDGFIAKSAAFKSVKKDILEAYRVKGKIYGLPKDAGSGVVAYIRKDWLDKLGLKTPTTWDELYAVMQAFTTKDPDGNGQNDTLGFTHAFNQGGFGIDYHNRLIMQDAFFGIHKDSKGKLVEGFLEPAFQKAVERYKKLYAEGIIDKEFFTASTSTARSKFTDGRVGIFEYWAGNWGKTMDVGAKNSNPKAEVIAIAPIKGSKYLKRIGSAQGIFSKSKNAASVFKYWIEFQLDKGVGETLFVYGTKGVNWDMVDGKMQFLPLKSNPKEVHQKAFVEPSFVPNDWPLPIERDSRLIKSLDVLNANSEWSPLVIGGTNYQKYYGEIWKMKQQIFSKMVMGDLSIADGIKQFRDKATKEYKLNEIIKEINTVK